MSNTASSFVFSNFDPRLQHLGKKVFKMLGSGRKFNQSGKKNLNPVTISIEGNVGSGKTTLLQYLNKRSNTEVILEPVEEWQNVPGGNILALMYEDPKKWSYLFQSYVLFTMLKVHQKPRTQPLKFIERSVYSANYCFVENLHLSGMLSKVEYSVYHEWFDMLMKQQKPNLDLIVYLRTSPENCLKRLKKRSRVEESSVSMDLLESIHSRYEDWLIKKKFKSPVPVLILDGNKPLSEMLESWDMLEESQLNSFHNMHELIQPLQS